MCQEALDSTNMVQGDMEAESLNKSEGGSNGITSGSQESSSGWVTTTQAAKALRVSSRAVRMFIEQGKLSGKLDQRSGKRSWLVSIDSLNTLRAQRVGEVPLPEEDAEVAEGVPEAIRYLADRLERRTTEAAELRTRVELTERAESTLQTEKDRLREDLERERRERQQEREERLKVQRKAEQLEQERSQAQEEAQKLQAELEAERSKGFWRRLFGG